MSFWPCLGVVCLEQDQSLSTVAGTAMSSTVTLGFVYQAPLCSAVTNTVAFMAVSWSMPMVPSVAEVHFSQATQHHTPTIQQTTSQSPWAPGLGMCKFASGLHVHSTPYTGRFTPVLSTPDSTLVWSTN